MHIITSWKSATLIALACGVAATPLLAQTPTRVTAPGSIVRPASDDGSALIEIATDGQAAVQIDVMALDGSDPTIKLLSASNADTVIADDDDGGAGLNARLVFDPESMADALNTDGHITIQIEDFALDGSLGNYAIVASTVAKLTPEKTIAYGAQETVTFGDDGAPHLYAFAAQAGDLIEIALDAVDGEPDDASVDPVLNVLGSPLASVDPIQSNDDRPDGGLNSLLRFVAPASATYFISAENLNGSAGQATLILKKAEPLPPPPTPTRISATQLGQGFCGEVAQDAPVLDWLQGDQHFALYGVSGRRNTSVTLRQSGDATIQIGYMTPAGFAEIASAGDDDGDGTRVIHWVKDGDVHILVAASAGTKFGFGSGTAEQLARCQ